MTAGRIGLTVTLASAAAVAAFTRPSLAIVTAADHGRRVQHAPVACELTPEPPPNPLDLLLVDEPESPLDALWDDESEVVPATPDSALAYAALAGVATIGWDLLAVDTTIGLLGIAATAAALAANADNQTVIGRGFKAFGDVANDVLAPSPKPAPAVGISMSAAVCAPPETRGETSSTLAMSPWEGDEEESMMDEEERLRTPTLSERATVAAVERTTAPGVAREHQLTSREAVSEACREVDEQCAKWLERRDAADASRAQATEAAQLASARAAEAAECAAALAEAEERACAAERMLQAAQEAKLVAEAAAAASRQQAEVARHTAAAEELATAAATAAEMSALAALREAETGLSNALGGKGVAAETMPSAQAESTLEEMAGDRPHPKPPTARSPSTTAPPVTLPSTPKRATVGRGMAKAPAEPKGQAARLRAVVKNLGDIAPQRLLLDFPESERVEVHVNEDTGSYAQVVLVFRPGASPVLATSVHGYRLQPSVRPILPERGCKVISWARQPRGAALALGPGGAAFYA